MAKKHFLPPNVKLFPDGCYYYRKQIPADCRAVVGCREVKRNLGYYLPVVAGRAYYLTVEIENTVRSIRMGKIKKQDKEKIDEKSFRAEYVMMGTFRNEVDYLQAQRAALAQHIVDQGGFAPQDAEQGAELLKKLNEPSAPVNVVPASATSTYQQQHQSRQQQQEPNSVYHLDNLIKMWTATKKSDSTKKKCVTAGNEIGWAFGYHRDVRTITTEDVRKFRDFYNTPGGFTRYSNRKGMTLYKYHLVGEPATEGYKKDITSDIKEFWHWMESEKYLNSSNSTLFDAIKIDNDKVRQRRDLMPSSVIKFIYDYVAPERDRIPQPVRDYNWRYWVFLLMAYSGAREGEICQLDLTDVLRKGDIDPNGSGKVILNQPCLAFRPSKDKSIKNKASIRTIPIHSHIARCGAFWDYVERRERDAGNEDIDPLRYPGKLFPFQFCHNGTGATKTASRYYNQIVIAKALEQPDIRADILDPDNPNISIYSLRHNVFTMLAQRADKAMTKRLLGHEDYYSPTAPGGWDTKAPQEWSETDKVYLHNLHGANALVDTVEMIDYKGLIPDKL